VVPKSKIPFLQKKLDIAEGSDQSEIATPEKT
jgi:hypothetical protein